LSYSSPGEDKSTQLPKLSGSWKELDHIRSLFGQEGNEFLKGSKATRAVFEQKMNEKYDIIHLATHASSSLTNRLSNQVIFPEKHKNDTLNALYGFDIIKLKIPASLVVLSACESASGVDQKGEGTYSLTRAFVLAGATNVIASIWQQADVSALAIQKQFYHGVKQNKSVAESLQKAKTAYLSNTGKQYAHLFYWAGVVSYGL